MNKDTDRFKLTCIPLGEWDYYGNWFPNLNLNMSVSDQRRHNIIGGHYNRYKQSDLHAVLVCDNEPSIFERLKRFLTIAQKAQVIYD